MRQEQNRHQVSGESWRQSDSVRGLTLVSPASSLKRHTIGTKGKVKVELPRFEPPPIPRCASSPVPLHYQQHRSDKLEMRQRLRDEAYQHLDFHGVGGDIDGLRALLTHKFGGSARGWRVAIAPDKIGNKSVTYSEFCFALKRIGYGGQIVTLWKTLSKGRLSIHLEDLEPDLAEQLDACARGISQNFENGAHGAWRQFARVHLARATYDEFVTFFTTWGEECEGLLSEDDIQSVNLRRIFQVLDVAGVGSVTKSDLHFLDHWAHRRLGVAMIEDEE